MHPSNLLHSFWESSCLLPSRCPHCGDELDLEMDSLVARYESLPDFLRQGLYAIKPLEWDLSSLMGGILAPGTDFLVKEKIPGEWFLYNLPQLLPIRGPYPSASLAQREAARIHKDELLKYLEPLP